jgi:hypothetical protein
MTADGLGDLRSLQPDDLLTNAVTVLREVADGQADRFRHLVWIHRITGRVLDLSDRAAILSPGERRALQSARESEHRQIAETRATVAHLRNAGVLASGGVVVKGPAVQQYLGGGHRERFSGDIDLVPGSATLRTLERAGYVDGGTAICHELANLDHADYRPVDLHHHIPVWTVDDGAVSSVPILFESPSELERSATLGCVPRVELAALIACAQLHRDLIEYPVWDWTPFELVHLLEFIELVRSPGFDDEQFSGFVGKYAARQSVSTMLDLIGALADPSQHVEVISEVARGRVTRTRLRLADLCSSRSLVGNVMAQLEHVETVALTPGPRSIATNGTGRGPSVTASAMHRPDGVELSLRVHFTGSVAYRDELALTTPGWSLRVGRSVATGKVRVVQYGDADALVVDSRYEDDTLHVKVSIPTHLVTLDVLLSAHNLVDPLRHDWNHFYQVAVRSALAIVHLDPGAADDAA